MAKKKIQSESARAAKQAIQLRKREAERKAKIAEKEAAQHIDYRRLEREEIERRRTALGAYMSVDVPVNQISVEEVCYVNEVDHPTPGYCCICCKKPGYEKRPTWSVSNEPLITRSFCRECMKGVFGREPRDLDPKTHHFKR